MKLIRQSTFDMHRHVKTSRTLIRNGLRVRTKRFQFVHLCQTQIRSMGTIEMGEHLRVDFYAVYAMC